MPGQESSKTASKSKVLVIVFLSSFLTVLAIWEGVRTTAVFSANNTLYASPNNQGSADCSSWGNACRLSTALSQASSGDEIWVEEGIHYPTTSSSDISATLQLINNITLYGGFDGTESVRSDRDWANNLTVLSGDIDKNDSTNADGILTNPEDIEGQNSYHVLMAIDVTETAVVDGFTITAGFASNSEPANGLNHDRGGGFYSDNSQVELNNISFVGNQSIFAGGAIHSANSDLTLENVHLENNFAIWEGGGINSTQDSNILINNSTFLNNSTGILDNMATGGAIYHATSDMTVTNTTFDGNSSNYHGGAVYHFTNSSATYTAVTFIKNTAENGGAVYNRGASPTFNRVTFQANEASEYGGVMYNYFDGDPVINNSLISGNYASLGAAGLFNFFNSDPVLNNVTLSGNSTDGLTGGVDSLQNSNPIIINSIFWNNEDSSGIGTLVASINNPTGSVQNSIIQGSGGSSNWNSQAGNNLGGNLDTNPQFASQSSPANAPSTAGDYDLQEGSPSVNGGDNDAYDTYSSSSIDLEGNTRIQNSVIDMGAIESAFASTSYLLTIELIGSGTGQLYLDGDALTCDGNCTVELDVDTAVSLTASPSQGSTFVGWSGDCQGTGFCDLIMDSAKSITVNFVENGEPIFYPLSIDVIGSGDGQLFLDGNLITCKETCTLEIEENTAVTLTASPDSNSIFAGWGEDCGGNESCQLTMSSAKAISASFIEISAPISYSLSIEKAGLGTGQLFMNGNPLNCDDGCTLVLEEETAVVLTATPNDGSTFEGWSGNCSGTDSCSLNMDSAKQVTITFNIEGISNNGFIIYLPLIIR